MISSGETVSADVNGKVPFPSPTSQLMQSLRDWCVSWKPRKFGSTNKNTSIIEYLGASWSKILRVCL